MPEIVDAAPDALNPSQDIPSHFDQLVSTVEDYAIFTLSPTGLIQDWNLGAQRLKGYTPEEIIGKHFSLFYPESLKKSGFPDQELERAARDGKFIDEGWRVRKDGTYFWANVTITALHSPEGEILGFLKITRDLTERRETTEALRQSEERFRLLLESVKDYAIFMLDTDGKVISWNSGARHIKGYEAKEILGQHFSVFYPVESLAAQGPQIFIGRALRDGTAQEEGWRVKKDGSLFWGHIQITALYDEHGDLRGFAKITRDLSDKVETEVLKDTSRRKDAFLATLAHELRNPLAPMLPALEMIDKAASDQPVVTSLVSTLRRQVGQMTHLINDLLDMSRITTGKIVLRKTRAELKDVIDTALEAVQPMIEDFGHHLELQLPDSPVELDVDIHRMAQIVSNLLANAAKYTPPGGKIVLNAAITRLPTLRISVRDNGRGIATAMKARIFDLFDQGVSGSDDGLGIGLTLVKSLVEQHGGSITVNSEGLGMGSEFVVLLPIAIPPSELPGAQAIQPTAQKTKLRKAKILIADDSKSAADILSMFFEMEGHETSVVYDGADAVSILESFSPDLAVLDLGMPRMNGYEAATLIRKKKPDTILVALSGWGSEEDKRRTAEAGFNHHLVKPVVPQDLRSLLTKYFFG